MSHPNKELTHKEKLREEIYKLVKDTPTIFVVDDILAIVERERRKAAERVVEAVVLILQDHQQGVTTMRGRVNRAVRSATDSVNE
jgi:vacuolar-type H+-ATPase subunit F/Vma7